MVRPAQLGQAASTFHEGHQQSLSAEGDEAQRNRLQRVAIAKLMMRLRFVFAAPTMDRFADTRAGDGDDVVINSIDAHGYAKVAGHHEQIISDMTPRSISSANAADVSRFCEGFHENARVEILLPACAAGASWLADS